jgi:hypothetical protein
MGLPINTREAIGDVQAVTMQLIEIRQLARWCSGCSTHEFISLSIKSVFNECISASELLAFL